MGEAPILWFRPSIRRAAVRIALVAIVFTVSGAFILGALRVGGVDFGSPWLAAYVLGIGCVVTGPFVLLRGHMRLLGQERVLTISNDGLRWQVGDARPRFCAWSDIVSVSVVGAELVIGIGAAPTDSTWRLPLPFEGIEGDELARLLRELQQKALLGLPVRPRAPASDDDRVSSR
ncbi:MAG: hypothetical protein U1F43_17830 [Myxococcota bacterium]